MFHVTHVNSDPCLDYCGGEVEPPCGSGCVCGFAVASSREWSLCPQVIPSPSCPRTASGAKSSRALCCLLAHGPAGDFTRTSRQLPSPPHNSRYAKNRWGNLWPAAGGRRQPCRATRAHRPPHAERCLSLNHPSIVSQSDPNRLSIGYTKGDSQKAADHCTLRRDAEKNQSEVRWAVDRAPDHRRTHLGRGSRHHAKGCSTLAGNGLSILGRPEPMTLRQVIGHSIHRATRRT